MLANVRYGMKIATIIILLMCMGCVAVPYRGYDYDYYYPDYTYRSYDYPYYRPYYYYYPYLSPAYPDFRPYYPHYYFNYRSFGRHHGYGFGFGQ